MRSPMRNWRRVADGGAMEARFARLPMRRELRKTALVCVEAEAGRRSQGDRFHERQQLGLPPPTVAAKAAALAIGFSSGDARWVCCFRVFLSYKVAGRCHHPPLELRRYRGGGTISRRRRARSASL